MPGSTIGHTLRLTTFGESHGGAVGGVLEGCPPNIRLDVQKIQHQLNRRRPGQSALTTQRREPDVICIESGLFEGKTLGTPIFFRFENRDTKGHHYRQIQHQYRPSHADFTWHAKMGIRAWPGGGRASARETVARVAAGAIAEQILRSLEDIRIVAWVQQIQELTCPEIEQITRAKVDKSIVRCPDGETSARFEQRIQQVKHEKDTVGGVIRAVITGVPAGLGEPVFDKLDADLAKAMISLPAAKGFSIGAGFRGALMRGSHHNDPFIRQNTPPLIATSTNHSGGIQGGISNGMPVVFDVAFKPVATLAQAQHTVDDAGNPTTIVAKGRHDPCVLPRAVPIVEAMAALTLADHLLRWRAQVPVAPSIPLNAPELS